MLKKGGGATFREEKGTIRNHHVIENKDLNRKTGSQVGEILWKVDKEWKNKTEKIWMWEDRSMKSNI